MTAAPAAASWMVDAPEPATAWPSAPPLTEDGLLRAFSSPGHFSVGVEEELMLLDPASLDASPRAQDALARVAGDARFRPELLASQIEIATPVLRSASQVADELAAARGALVDALEGEILVAGAGVHPRADGAAVVMPAPRYAAHEREYRWVATDCGPTFGLHVHVAVPGADRALAVFNAMRSYLPEIGALGANAPFFRGRDTGLASVRPKLTEAFNRSGVPPALSSWSELVQLVEWGRRSGSFPDASHLWWDVRPHATYGTLEVRIPDAQTRPEDAAAMAAFVQTLAAWLAARHDAGERLPSHDVARIAENRWRALRHGVHGWLADLDSGEPEPTRVRLLRLLEALRDTAGELGVDDALTHARTLVAGTGADRQRRVASRGGLDGLLAWLAHETCGRQRVRHEPLPPSYP